ncbi:hypothetical protein ACU686_22890 [Yinghuangia aomiensis]
MVFAGDHVCTPFVMRPAHGRLRARAPRTPRSRRAVSASPWQIIRRILLPEALPRSPRGGSLHAAAHPQRGSASCSSSAPKDVRHFPCSSAPRAR